MLDVSRAHRRKRRLFDPQVTKLRLQLDELREIRDELRLPRISEIDRRENQSAGDGERSERLQRYLNYLKGRVHVRVELKSNGVRLD